jgi:hypothetical protein
LQVYLLLIDPELGGLSQSRISDQLELRRPTISGHVESLVSGDFVKAVEGCKCPILYTKGAKSPQLDALVLERRVRDTIRSCVGHARPNTFPPSTISPPCQDLSRVEDARVHANGSVSFKVEKIGDLHELVIKRDGPNGKVERVKLFGLEPSISEEEGRGASSYDSHIYVNGQKVRLQFWQGKEKSTMRIWPSEKKLPPSLIPTDHDALERFMESQAQDVANFISKYGGWRFGLPQFNGQIETASQDPRILDQISKDIKRVEGVPDAWVDGSPPGKGKREFETTNLRKARAVFEFDKTADEVDGHSKRIYILESDSKRILALLENLVKAQAMEAELHVASVARDVEETASKIAERAAQVTNGAKATLPDDKKERYGVSYIG